jgi:multidrug resistance efflux pump
MSAITNSPEQGNKDTGNWALEQQSDVWQTFANPRSDGEFCQAWLALLCRQLPGVKAGVVLYQSDEANTFVPVAVWPDVTRDLSFLGKVAERALTERRGVVHRPENNADAHVHVAYPVEIAQRMVGSVVLEVTPRPEPEIHALLRQLHWGIAWLYNLSQRRELTSLETKADRIGSVMEVLTTALQQNRLQQALFDVANHVARHLDCSRVAVGLVDEDTVRIKALSNAAWFEKNANIVKLYAAAMEEVYDRLAAVVYQRTARPETTAESEPGTAHGRLARESGAQDILSIPLQLGAECIGVLTLERNTGNAFSAEETAWAEALAGLLPSVIDQKRRAERGYLDRMREDVRKLMTRWFGPKYLIWKFTSSLALLLLALMTLVSIDYRVAAKTVVEGEIQRVVAVPFASFVAESYVRAGDVVKKDQVLCALDDSDLRLEQNKWKSEREQSSQKLREAMAKHELSAVQVLNAQMQQAEAQLALVEERLARARVTAPFDGIVISGDLSQLIGSPVEQGKKLFEIAPLDAYRVILQVDEREIRHVQTGQTGKLVITGIANDPIPFSVSKVTPVATAEDGRNFFRVEARLEQTPARLRPGMEGVGKISVGEQRLWWVMTHSFTDWLRLTLWTWLP